MTTRNAGSTGPKWVHVETHTLTNGWIYIYMNMYIYICFFFGGGSGILPKYFFILILDVKQHESFKDSELRSHPPGPQGKQN